MAIHSNSMCIFNSILIESLAAFAEIDTLILKFFVENRVPRIG